MRFHSIAILVLMTLVFTVQPAGALTLDRHLPVYHPSYFPDTQWTSTTPEEQGMNSTILTDMIQFINESGAPYHGLVVARNGYIVTEQYWGYRNENSSHHIFSATKSFTSTLIGVAIKEGFIDNVSQHVLDFFPEITVANPDPLKDSMTIEHLLTMTHGLDWNEWNCSYETPENMYNQMFYQSGDPIQFFLDLPLIHTPGEVWVYTTGASYMLSAILQEATGMTTRAFAEEYLFGPLNATISSWTAYYGVNHGGTQLYLTPRTMTKLGVLYLNNGTWNGQQILTEEYVTAATTPYIQSLMGGLHYGYQWFIDTESDSFLALGSEGQNIAINPGYNVVVAITAGLGDVGPDLSNEIFERVARSIIEFDPSAVTQTETTSDRQDSDTIQPLVIVGLVSIPIAVVIVGVLYTNNKVRFRK